MKIIFDIKIEDGPIDTTVAFVKRVAKSGKNLAKSAVKHVVDLLPAEQLQASDIAR